MGLTPPCFLNKIKKMCSFVLEGFPYYWLHWSISWWCGRYEYKCTKYRRQECRTVWQNQCNGRRGRRRRRSTEEEQEEVEGEVVNRYQEEDPSEEKIKWRTDRGFIDSKTEEEKLLLPELANRRSKQMKKQKAIDGQQSNWAVNQTTVKPIGLDFGKKVRGRGHVGGNKLARGKRSPRGPPYWLQPENNLVVDDPPPPEVSDLIIVVLPFRNNSLWVYIETFTTIPLL